MDVGVGMGGSQKAYPDAFYTIYENARAVLPHRRENVLGKSRGNYRRVGSTLNISRS